MGAQDIRPHGLPHVHGDRIFVQPHHRDPRHVRERLDHLFLREKAPLQKQVPHGMSGLGLCLPQLVRLLLRQQMMFQQIPQQPLVHGGLSLLSKGLSEL